MNYGLKLQSSRVAMTTLKAKSRDMNRAFKAANSRIADLETEVAELREQAASVQVVAKPVKEAKAPRAGRSSRKAPIDLGDAVPQAWLSRNPSRWTRKRKRPGTPWRSIYLAAR